MSSSLKDKKILLGVSGSIAAYKSAFLVRQLVKEGASVRVIMTSSASDFVSPLTFSTLSKNPVASDIHDEQQWNNHVEYGLWADAMVIAPATAHTIARCATGMASDLLVATYLSARCPVFFAPAMDLDMWVHPSTAENISRLQSYGNFILDVGIGELASGLHGPGRMAEPEVIIQQLHDFFRYRMDMTGVNVLINAGPTHEAIDPVRYIGNHSTGKMGVAIAEAFSKRGASVELVLGPGSVEPYDEKINITHITTADEMLKACITLFPKADVTVLAAAVADYKPEKMADEKIKKSSAELHLRLVSTPDIASTLGKQKRADQVLIGFALETQDGETHAREKMEKKNMDMIVLNNPREAGAGFGHDTNKVTFLFPDNTLQRFELKSKTEVAQDIAEAAFKLKHANAIQ
ncbi:MAG TPA: bifunctional phosphopantothenoylcysteine decarboxylase/phosphopantothenate--cysteine ligase CoaBC [Saprospiraceae bacterium]|nr:bifunctional phosphopantothenoylcysteine decarboxylase/phosphopantothenate--cysteine ligase CoaBC [Saprospiraceae bacterium]